MVVGTDQKVLRVWKEPVSGERGWGGMGETLAFAYFESLLYCTEQGTRCLNSPIIVHI